MRYVVQFKAWCLAEDSFRAVPNHAWRAVQNFVLNLLSLSDTIVIIDLVGLEGIGIALVCKATEVIARGFH